MVSIHEFRKLAMSFPDATELPHFEKTSFRVKKKIFATLDVKTKVAVVKFSAIDQSVFADAGNGAVYAVPGKWGKSGYTCIELKKSGKKMVMHALTISFCNVAPAKLAQSLQRK